ncbi:MAG: hypothetical protein JRG91_13295 [Deltaproteobacteria bacterium]|nr:hypothetical protein [Deltaproteobacteria bacterium]
MDKPVQVKSTSWMPTAVAVLAAVVLVQVLLLSKIWCASGRLDDRLAGVEESLEELEGAAELAEALVESQEELEDQVDAIRASTVYSSGKLSTLDTKVDHDMGDLASTLAGLFPQIETLVDQKVEEKLGGTGKAARPRFKSMDALAEDLALNQYQKQKTGEIFNQAKYEAFEVVNQPREDGTSIVQELRDTVMSSSKPHKDGMKVLMKLMVENVPGTDETYFSRLTKIREDAIDEAGENMSPEQAAKLGSMSVNAYAVETGYNPLTDFFKDAMGGE